MFKTYLKIAWRNLVRNKVLSFINIFGLALGMAFTILIGLWIWFQYSYDRFNTNADRISLSMRHMEGNGQKLTSVIQALPLYNVLKQNYPGIERISRMDQGGDHSLTISHNKFNKNGLLVDPAFLQMFTFPALEGNVNTALNDPNAIVLTESLAKTMFGDEDPIGKIIRVDDQYNAKVSAVLRDVPNNSTISFEYLRPYEWAAQHDDNVKGSLTNWNNNFLYILVERKKGVSLDALNKQLAPLLTSVPTGEKVATLFLYPLLRLNLYGDFKDWVEVGTKIEYVRMFGIIGVFILLIACINFMNLSTARSERRSREVGIRKTVGSKRRQLVAQFLTESLLTSLLAFVLALGIIQLLLPYLQDIGFDNVRFSVNNIGILGVALGLCLMTGLIAGSYPAAYLSSFRPIKVLKGKFKQGRHSVRFREVLVVSQFVISIGLIIATTVVILQIGHARHRPLGYDPNNLISFDATPDLTKNYFALKQELEASGKVASVTRSSSAMAWISNDFGHWSWEGKDPNAIISVKTVMVDFDYEQTAGLQFVSGRPHSMAYKTDSTAIVLNEAAVQMIGYKDPVGKTINLGGDVKTIIGVTKNVLMEDPFKPVPPAILLFNPGSCGTILVRLKNGADLRSDLDILKPIVEKYDPSAPWAYHFADKYFEDKFATENQVGKLSGLFAGLAIVISCMGLFGLAMFMAERRSKEISIRKVLGATVSNLCVLMSREFFWLVLLAALIASPIAMWFMDNWLKHYDYRIQISWWIPVSTGLLAILIALGTVSFQALRVAKANPSRHLKDE